MLFKHPWLLGGSGDEASWAPAASHTKSERRRPDEPWASLAPVRPDCCRVVLCCHSILGEQMGQIGC